MNSFIESALTKMTDGSGSNAGLAQIVENRISNSAPNRIAMTYVHLQNARITAKDSGNEPKYKPEQLLSFIQQLMNNICWAARRTINAQRLHEAGEQAAGVDFSEQVAEEAGVEAVATENIAKYVDADYQTLVNVQSWLAKQMNYLTEIDDLAYFRQQQVDEDGVWYTAHEAFSFGDAESCMEECIAQMQRDNSEVIGEQAATYDFGVTVDDLGVSTGSGVYRVSENPTEVVLTANG